MCFSVQEYSREVFTRNMETNGVAPVPSDYHCDNCGQDFGASMVGVWVGDCLPEDDRIVLAFCMGCADDLYGLLKGRANFHGTHQTQIHGGGARLENN